MAELKIYLKIMVQYSTIETKIRANINNSSAVVSGVIDEAIALLSNFFKIETLDTSKSTVIGQDYITKPTRCFEVVKLKIGDKYYEKTNLSKLEEMEEFELEKFYEYGDNIRLLITPTEISTCKIWCKTGFSPLLGVAGNWSDVPEHILPALYILATWLYWLQIVSNVGTEREDFPDMTVEEAEKISDIWAKQFKQIIETIKTK